jgi:hypothetical protein
VLGAVWIYFGDFRLEFYIEEWSLKSLFRELSFISKIPAIKTLLETFTYSAMKG